MILGIDPGLANLGWAVMDVDELVEYGCIKTKVGLKTEVRLEDIYRQVKILIKKYKVDGLVIESLYFAKNAKSVIKVAEVMGVIKLCAKKCGVEVDEFTPLQIKVALTGYGRASKEQVEDMVKRLLGRKETIQPDHASDAVAVAMTRERYNRL